MHNYKDDPLFPQTLRKINLALEACSECFQKKFCNPSFNIKISQSFYFWKILVSKKLLVKDKSENVN